MAMGRTASLDIVTVALNMYSQGLHPELDFAILIRSAKYTNEAGMTVHDRHPYGGDLVFTFFWFHQDAIKKEWTCVRKKVLPKRPLAGSIPINRSPRYWQIVREQSCINSQSGKGGVACILSREFGLELPKAMHPEVGFLMNAKADSESRN